MTSKFTKMTRSEYRWKILLPPYYENGLDGSPTLKGEWISSKRECYKDFLKKNSEIDGDREAYLYKRMILPDHFLIFGKSKYHEYKYKIKASFHREEDLWTMYESKWDRKLKQTLSDLKTLRKRGYDYVCCCEPIEYLYMRRPFPIENLPPFETEIHYPEDNDDDDDGKPSEKRRTMDKETKEPMEFDENGNSDTVPLLKDN